MPVPSILSNAATHASTCRRHVRQKSSICLACSSNFFDDDDDDESDSDGGVGDYDYDDGDDVKDADDYNLYYFHHQYFTLLFLL